MYSVLKAPAKWKSEKAELGLDTPLEGEISPAIKRHTSYYTQATPLARHTAHDI